MIKYTSTGESPQFSGSERFVWPAIKRKIDIDAMAYVNTIEKNRINGKNGGRGKKKDVDTAENPENSENTVNISNPRKPSEFMKTPENPVGLLKNPENPVGLLKKPENPKKPRTRTGIGKEEKGSLRPLFPDSKSVS